MKLFAFMVDISLFLKYGNFSFIEYALFLQSVNLVERQMKEGFCYRGYSPNQFIQSFILALAVVKTGAPKSADKLTENL